MHASADQLAVYLDLDLYDAGWKGPDYFGPDHRQFAMTSLHRSIVKKFHNDETDEGRDSLALQVFKDCNERCKSFGSVIPRRLDEEYVIGEMKTLLYDFFNPRFRKAVDSESVAEEYTSFREPLLLNLNDIAVHFGLGGGSNIGTRSNDFYSKYVTSVMCHTNPVLPLLFRQAISVNKLWAGIEAFRLESFGDEVVQGSRLSFAPKSHAISRTICTEPILNMLFQKGIGGVLEDRLKEVYGIDFSHQPSHNADLARIGSVDGSFGTIDLSSASDTISLTMLREMLPKEPLQWLLRCRSPSTVLPDGSELELHMVSSMGNGYTFPLQTVIFTCLVAAAYKVYEIRLMRPGKSNPGNFAIFGDDIIVDKRVYDVVCRCLDILGFRVNRDKSFNEGWFRESCGSDFHLGHNIRGVYVKALRDDLDFYSAINRLNRWSARHRVFLSQTITFLRGHCRFIGVPYDEGDDTGIKVPFSLLRNPKYDRNMAVKYNAAVVRPGRVTIPSVDCDLGVGRETVMRIRRQLPDFVYHGDGLLFCLVAGWLRNGALGLRVNRRVSVLRRRVCPGWDERIAAAGESWLYREDWKFFTVANLVS